MHSCRTTDIHQASFITSIFVAMEILRCICLAYQPHTPISRPLTPPRHAHDARHGHPCNRDNLIKVVPFSQAQIARVVVEWVCYPSISLKHLSGGVAKLEERLMV